MPPASTPATVSSHGQGRAERLDTVLEDFLTQAPQMQAAAVVSFDGLPMASALPSGMDEDRVAAMSAALLSLGERAAAGLGRGELSQVYVEGDNGTVFLVSADDEAVLVAVAARGAKVGLMLFEAKQAAAAVADVLRTEMPSPEAQIAPFDEPVAADAASVGEPDVASTAVYVAQDAVVPFSQPTEDFEDVANGLDAVAADNWGGPGQGWA